METRYSREVGSRKIETQRKCERKCVFIHALNAKCIGFERNGKE